MCAVKELTNAFFKTIALYEYSKGEILYKKNTEKSKEQSNLTEHFNFFFVKAVGNGSLFVGPKFSTIEEEEERIEIMNLAHRQLKEAAIDVSRLLKNEDYGELSFYINNKLKDALEILHEIDEEF